MEISNAIMILKQKKNQYYFITIAFFEHRMSKKCCNFESENIVISNA